MFSVLMSVSACAALVNAEIKTNYTRLKSFLMICIPKTIFSLIRYYFENFESNYFLLIILLLSMMIFDTMILFVVFDCKMIQKVMAIAMLDIIFIPVLLVKQTIESKFTTPQNTIEFNNIIQPVLALLIYTVLFTIIVLFAHVICKIIKKINFDKPIFDIFGVLALFAYLSIELISCVMFWQNLVGRTNQFIQYFNCALIYCCSLSLMYLISSHFTKKRLRREIEILNAAKEQEYKYYDLMKNHNEEIRKIKHDLNSHFDVMLSLINSKQYDKLNDYITGLSDNYNQIRKVVYTSNMMVDAVISSAIEKCNKNNIIFSFEGMLPDPCFVDDISVTCIFSNILNNAIESCEKMNENKYIKLSVFYKKECIVVECKNSKLTTPKNRDILKSSKQSAEHGFGIKIIKDIVAEYNGVACFTDNKNEFEVSILIPSKDTLTV